MLVHFIHNFTRAKAFLWNLRYITNVRCQTSFDYVVYIVRTMAKLLFTPSPNKHLLSQQEQREKVGVFLILPTKFQWPKMLCPSALRSLLDQANSGSVGSTILINSEGSVLAHSGSTSDRHAIATAAVASHAWNSYEKAGLLTRLSTTSCSSRRHGGRNGPRRSSLMSDDGSLVPGGQASSLRFMILDCSEGRAALAVIPGTDLIVCLFADTTWELGHLKKKVLAITKYLEEPVCQMLNEVEENAW